MAIININIPANLIARFDTGISKAKGRRDNLPDPANPGQEIPNPESKNDFAVRMIKEFIVGTMADVEGEQEADAVGSAKRISTRNDFDAIIVTP